MNLLDQVSSSRKEIKYETLSISVSELLGMYGADPKEITINPNFQRLFRWSRKQQSDFIESLVLEIPIPPAFFYETDKGTWELLDGLQRLSTIIRFFTGGDVPDAARGKQANEHEWHYEHENNPSNALQLLAGERLTELAGHTFSTLPEQLRLNLKRARIQIYVLKRETHPMFKYEVFNRLNRGGSILEEQEIRNCSSRMISDRFPDYLQDLAKFQAFREAVGREGEEARNGYVEELALRFLAVKNKHERFQHDLAEFLTNYMKEVTAGTLPFDEPSEKVLFQDTWTLLNNALTGGNAFRGRNSRGNPTGPFSPALFEIVSLSVAFNIEKVRQLEPEQLEDKITKLILEGKSRGFTGAGSNARSKFEGRVALGKEWFGR